MLVESAEREAFLQTLGHQHPVCVFESVDARTLTTTKAFGDISQQTGHGGVKEIKRAPAIWPCVPVQTGY